MATILITDDEANIVSGLKYAFEDEGFSVLTAGNGLEAWHEINTNSVDLVITDLRMPEMDGYELIKKISASYPTLPVIVLTGHGTIETAVETMRDGAIDFFTKPVDIDKLSLVGDVVGDEKHDGRAMRAHLFAERLERGRAAHYAR